MLLANCSVVWRSEMLYKVVPVSTHDHGLVLVLLPVGTQGIRRRSRTRRGRARGRGRSQKGESLTLSGSPAVDGSNSWQSICGMLREQEERFRRLMKKAEAAGKSGTGEGGESGLCSH